MADAADIARLFRAESARAVSRLCRLFGDLDVAEEAVQDAFAVALERWPKAGLPPSPAGWILTTAKNRAIDRLRRESTRAERHETAWAMLESEPPAEEGAVKDDVLGLLFTCCHPALAMPARVALTLRLVGGLSTPEIARAFLVPEPTMAQRLVRAKAKIRDARIPFRLPHDDDLEERLSGVLHVVYLVFNEGYAATSGDELVRAELCEEAIRLGRLLLDLVPDEPEVWGLVALMLLVESRRLARTTVDGELVVLSEQRRGLWNRALVEEGQRLVRRCLAVNRPGPFQIQAAIQAVHADAPNVAATDWRQIVALYDQLLALAPSRVVELQRAIAVAEIEGPAAGLALVGPLAMDDQHLFHATRADFLRRLGRDDEAADAYARAIERCANGAERRFLERRRTARRPG